MPLAVDTPNFVQRLPGFATVPNVAFLSGREFDDHFPLITDATFEQISS
jgi:hypothetical protein